MKIAIIFVLAFMGATAQAADIRDAEYGQRLPGGGAVALWWCDAGWKVGQTKAVPTQTAEAITIRCAKNEREAAQLILTPAQPLEGLTVTAGALISPSGATIAMPQVEVLRVGYVNIAHATDSAGGTGLWPDPLLPLRGPCTLAAHQNQPFWIRLSVPAEARAGQYAGEISLAAGAWHAAIPLRVEVFNFALPDKLTCTTALGLETQAAFRYHGARTLAQKRQVLDMYWRTFAAHHIAPYDPAPLDPIQIDWPAARPPPLPWADWHGGRVVTNEAHTGHGSLAIFDDRRDAVVGATYEPLLRIPAAGLKIRLAYRTAFPDHTFDLALQYYDQDGKWISGQNHDIRIVGDGHWTIFERTISKFPPQAQSFQLTIYATDWTEDGAQTGLLWIDDVEIRAATSGTVLLHADFEAPGPRPPVAPAEQLQPRMNFTAWDREMRRTQQAYHFNSFRLNVEGLGGGTFEAGMLPPAIDGFPEDMPEYDLIFGSYTRQLEAHLRAMGWLDSAFVYWFDEPSAAQYDYVRHGFEKLRRTAPALRGMITEQVEPPLIGGPQIWCSLSDRYNPARAEERRKLGEHFWWYICCGPKAPYATEFIDHPGTNLRVWLWQTWQRRIEGVLIWATNYWTSPTAYPDRPQNPYTDPMSWVSGGKPGQKRPWGNGDGRFLYPPEAGADGHPATFIADPPVDSVRWEMLRDGLEDYEYLALLRRGLAKQGATLDAAKRAAFEKLLEVPPEISTDMTHFTTSPEPIAARRLAVARALEQLPP